MALQFFDSTPDSNDLLFINDWITENPKNKQKEFEIESIMAVKSGKGYLIKTDRFMVFLFKNQAIAKKLVEALKVYTREELSGYKLVVFLPKPNKPDFRLAADKETKVTWYEAGNGYSTSSELSASLAEAQANPFL